MKVVLFCGGFGTRLREFSETIPKPLVPVGNRPILWHLMKYYAHHGFKEFVLCLGFRGEMIKEFFLNYNDCLSTDFTLSAGASELHGPDISDWKITFVDTGLHNNIGQRLVAVRNFLDDDMFLANYSDGLSDLPLGSMIKQFETDNSSMASFVAVRPSNNLSKIETGADGRVTRIEYLSNSIRINGGFFVMRPEIFSYIEKGEELVEQPFQRLIDAGRLTSYVYDGFWRAMDTFKDKKRFDEMHASGIRPWEVWSRSVCADATD